LSYIEAEATHHVPTKLVLLALLMLGAGIVWLVVEISRTPGRPVKKRPWRFYHELAVMPNSVARLAVVVVVLGKMRAADLLQMVMRAADLLQMVVFGEIGSDQEDGCEGEPGKQNESDHHKLHRWIGRG
jgi:hypothetical protein